MEDYEKLSHTHCWNQGVSPACGIPLMDLVGS